MLLPPGSQMPPSAPVEIVVSCCGWPQRTPLLESKSHIQICAGSVAFELKMMRLPSGEKRGRSSSFSVGLSRRASPPVAGTIQSRDLRVFSSTFTLNREKTTHLPSGVGAGSLTRLSAIMSSKVNGRLPVCGAVCAAADTTRARNRATILRVIRKSPIERANCVECGGRATACAPSKHESIT